MPTEPLVFEKAHALCYRIYDIADEIDLEKARQALAQDARRLKLSRENSQYIQLPNPPVAYELGRRVLALRAGPVTVDSTARLFDHGAASIIITVPIPEGCSFEQLTALADELYDSQALEALAAELLEGVKKTIAPAAVMARSTWEQNESYTVIFAERIRGAPSAEEVLARRGTDLAAVAAEVVDRLLATGGELVTLVRGAEADESLVAAVTGHLRRNRPDLEVVVLDGGQERYPLLMGVE